MTTYREAQEAFNRVSHSDALREMQLTGLTESPPCASSYRYVDPTPVRPVEVVRSLFNWRDLFVSIATAVLLVIVIPGVLLVLSIL